MRPESSRTHLERLAGVVQCVACGHPCRPASTAEGLACTRCTAFYPLRHGVLLLDPPSERAEVAAEREGVAATEQNPALGGINDRFDDLARAEGALREAILALPTGNESRYYAEPGYFRNVQTSQRGFRFIVERLARQPGQRLLDVGADLTSGADVAMTPGRRPQPR